MSRPFDPTPTMRKFGFPRTLVADSPKWLVLLRPQQPTLGSLVLVCKEPVTAFGQASPEAFAALQPVVSRVERLLDAVVGYQKINYLMLMMVDPDVHFHVIPRYDGTRTWRGMDIPDHGWPGPPSLGTAVALDEEAQAALTAELSARWTELGQ